MLETTPIHLRDQRRRDLLSLLPFVELTFIFSGAKMGPNGVDHATRAAC